MFTQHVASKQLRDVVVAVIPSVEAFLGIWLVMAFCAPAGFSGLFWDILAVGWHGGIGRVGLGKTE